MKKIFSGIMIERRRIVLSNGNGSMRMLIGTTMMRNESSKNTLNTNNCNYHYNHHRNFSSFDDSIRSKIRQTIEKIEKEEQQKQNQQPPRDGKNVADETPSVNPEDEGIHPDWLALERRLTHRRPKPKVDPNQPSRGVRRPSGWDGENV